jgi:hypothetical protein
MGLFDMLGNMGSAAVDSAQGGMGASMDFLRNPLEGVSRTLGGSADFMKAISSEDPDALGKFLEDNPSFLTTSSPVGIPELPGMPFPMQQSPGFKINQMPNFLNSAQQVLSGGY